LCVLYSFRWGGGVGLWVGGGVVGGMAHYQRERSGMLVISLKGADQRFFAHLRCSGRNQEFD